jgi:hypothetical protein
LNYLVRLIAILVLSIPALPANATVTQKVTNTKANQIAYSETILIGDINEGDADQACKTNYGYATFEAYVSQFLPNQQVAVCTRNLTKEVGTGGINVGESTSNYILSFNTLCNLKYYNSGYGNPRWSWQNNACIGEVSNPNIGKGDSDNIFGW